MAYSRSLACPRYIFDEDIGALLRKWPPCKIRGLFLLWLAEVIRKEEMCALLQSRKPIPFSLLKESVPLGLVCI